MLNEVATGYVTLKMAKFYFATQPHPVTIERWVRIGLKNKENAKKPNVFLRAICEGGVLLTRPEWIETFKRDCTTNRLRRKFRKTSVDSRR